MSFFIESMTAVPEKLELDMQEHDNWHSLFRMMDTNNQGVIPVRDLKNAVFDTSINLGLTRDEADTLLMDVDKNQDKFVDFAEFCSLMAKAKKLHMKRVLFYAAKSVLSKKSQGEAHRYLLQYNCFPPPLFMIIISVLEISFYLYYTFKDGGHLEINGPQPIDSPYILNPNKKEQIWRYLTYMFIHIGYLHLISNVVVQLLLGLPLELVHKLWRISALYLLGVITGAVLVYAVDPGVYLGGASAGVYALIAAHISNVVINWSEMQFNWIRAIILGIIVFADTGIAIYERYGKGVRNRTSYVAHIGGFIAGLLLGIVLLRNLRWKRWERVAWWICLVAYVLFMITCIILIFSPPMFSSNKKFD
ncbi:Rhomboid protease [Aphelenchoides bicaudatus]|nr:Rhomboid protease [Aphelenchoides bicaudatus]